MDDVPGTTLNTTPQWNAWLNQLYANGANRALPMFTYNSNSPPPMLTPQGALQSPSLPGVQFGRPNMPIRANANTLPGLPPVGTYPQTPPELPFVVNSNNRPAPVVGFPLMAPQMVGHPIGLRERERSILSRFEDE
jgi:hypothetical protein